MSELISYIYSFFFWELFPGKNSLMNLHFPEWKSNNSSWAFVFFLWYFLVLIHYITQELNERYFRHKLAAWFDPRLWSGTLRWWFHPTYVVSKRWRDLKSRSKRFWTQARFIQQQNKLIVQFHRKYNGKVNLVFSKKKNKTKQNKTEKTAYDYISTWLMTKQKTGIWFFSILNNFDPPFNQTN